MKPFFLFSNDTLGEGYVPNNEIFFYASGLAGQNVAYNYVSGWLRYFCVNILKINALKVGAIFSASYAWDAVNDPIIGAIVDRGTHKPFRKLRPYILYTPPIIGLILVAMFIELPVSENIKIAYMLCTYFIFDFFYSFQDVGLWGMIALSSPYSYERSRVAQWVSIGAGAGGAIAGTFQQLRTMLINKGHMSNSSVFFMFAVIFGLGGELASMSAYRINERVSVENKKKESFFKALTALKYNPTLILISLARFAQGFSPKIQNAYFFENKVTFMNGQSAEFVFGLFSGILGAGAMFFANKIAHKIGGMKKLLIISQIFAIVFRIIAFFAGFNSLPRFIIMTTLIAIVNFPGSLMDIAHRSLTSDSIDEVELKTGLRSEGVSFSMQNFTTKLTSGVSSFIEGVLLNSLGYNADAKEAGLPQSDTFLKWQWPMFMLGPVVGSVLYLFFISFIRDSREHMREVERLLKERRESIPRGV